MHINTIGPLVSRVVAPIASQAISSLTHAIDFKEIFSKDADQAQNDDSAAKNGEFLAINGSPKATTNQLDRLQQLADELSQKLSQLLIGQGFDLSQPIQLSSDGMGGIQVGGSHSQRAEIEKLLSKSGSIEGLFHELVATRYRADNRDSVPHLPDPMLDAQTGFGSQSIRPAELTDYRAEFHSNRVTLSRINS